MLQTSDSSEVETTWESNHHINEPAMEANIATEIGKTSITPAANVHTDITDPNEQPAPIDSDKTESPVSQNSFLVTESDTDMDTVSASVADTPSSKDDFVLVADPFDTLPAPAEHDAMETRIDDEISDIPENVSPPSPEPRKGDAVFDTIAESASVTQTATVDTESPEPAMPDLESIQITRTTSEPDTTPPRSNRTVKDSVNETTDEEFNKPHREHPKPTLTKASQPAEETGTPANNIEVSPVADQRDAMQTPDPISVTRYSHPKPVQHRNPVDGDMATASKQSGTTNPEPAHEEKISADTHVTTTVLRAHESRKTNPPTGNRSVQENQHTHKSATRMTVASTRNGEKKSIGHHTDAVPTTETHLSDTFPAIDDTNRRMHRHEPARSQSSMNSMQPKVVIGQVNVTVEIPTQQPAKPATTSMQHNDFASRHYLRRLR